MTKGLARQDETVIALHQTVEHGVASAIGVVSFGSQRSKGCWLPTVADNHYDLLRQGIH